MPRSNLQRSRSRTTTMATPLPLFVLLAALFVSAFVSVSPFASAQKLGTQVSDLPLFAQSTVHCDDMITLHRWEGDCCSLNVTAGNGCVLNVMDGHCKITGQVWTLDFTSSYNEKPCPGSQYSLEQLDISVSEDETDDGSSSNTRNPGLSFCAAVFVGFVGAMGLMM